MLQANIATDIRTYLIDRKFRLAVGRVRGRVARLQRMREGAAERRRWEAIRDAEVHRQVEAELAAAAGSSYMGKIWYRLRRSRFQARLDAAGTTGAAAE